MEHEFHRELKHIVALWLQSTGCTVYEEQKLPNRRISDVAAVNNAERVLLVEVKTVLTDSLVQAAYTKYAGWADALYVAGPASDVHGLLWVLQRIGTTRPHDRVGLIAVIGGTASIARQAQLVALPEHRRVDILAQLRRNEKRRMQPGEHRPTVVQPRL